MIKQCINCKRANNPSKRSACNVKIARHELLNAYPMELNSHGMQCCKDYKPAYKEQK